MWLWLLIELSSGAAAQVVEASAIYQVSAMHRVIAIDPQRRALQVLKAKRKANT